MKYYFQISGTAAGKQTWSHSGEVETQNAGAFTSAFDLAMQSAFAALTKGKAQFGNPGLGCGGPYSVTRLEISAQPIDKAK